MILKRYNLPISGFFTLNIVMKYIYVKIEKEIYEKLPCLVMTGSGKTSRVFWCLEATLDPDGVPEIESENDLVGILENKDLDSTETLEIYKNLSEPALDAGFERFRLMNCTELIYEQNSSSC